MKETGLWSYCTRQQSLEFLLSLRLFGNTSWPDEKQISCLYTLSNHTLSHYRHVRIPKQTGGFRSLYIPDPLLRKVQRNILHHILDQIPVSDYAKAYRKGTSIVSNAAVHTGHDLLLKLDIQDFFGSILFPTIRQHAFPSIYFPPDISVLLTFLCSYRDFLPQGAPTSPTISNLVMKPFDESMGAWCKDRNISYSRYCDDMTFSGTFDAHSVKRKAASFLSEMGYTLNNNKTRIIPAYRRQSVTGIVVNTRPQVSQDYRKKLRQTIYYCEKFGIASHLAQTCDNSYLPMGDYGVRRYQQMLLGKINFVLQANPADSYFRQAKERMQHVSLILRNEYDKVEM